MTFAEHIRTAAVCSLPAVCPGETILGVKISDVWHVPGCPQLGRKHQKRTAVPLPAVIEELARYRSPVCRTCLGYAAKLPGPQQWWMDHIAEFRGSYTDEAPLRFSMRNDDDPLIGVYRWLAEPARTAAVDAGTCQGARSMLNNQARRIRDGAELDVAGGLCAVTDVSVAYLANRRLNRDVHADRALQDALGRWLRQLRHGRLAARAAAVDVPKSSRIYVSPAFKEMIYERCEVWGSIVDEMAGEWSPFGMRMVVPVVDILETNATRVFHDQDLLGGRRSLSDALLLAGWFGPSVVIENRWAFVVPAAVAAAAAAPGPGYVAIDCGTLEPTELAELADGVVPYSMLVAAVLSEDSTNRGRDVLEMARLI